MAIVPAMGGNGGDGSGKKPRSRARARPPEEMYDIAVETCVEIAQDDTLDPSPRVGAAKTLAELATRGKVGGTDTPMDPAEVERRYRELAVRLFGEEAAKLLAPSPASSEPASSDGAEQPPLRAGGGADSGEGT